MRQNHLRRRDNAEHAAERAQDAAGLGRRCQEFGDRGLGQQMLQLAGIAAHPVVGRCRQPRLAGRKIRPRAAHSLAHGADGVPRCQCAPRPRQVQPPAPRRAKVFVGRGRKGFFFEKKNQKTFIHLRKRRVSQIILSEKRSFCFFFFRKRSAFF
ncbi:MAG: hypothetical protein IT555_02700 [Acetobacteraceae bacterium]|nr:hypothetical protein [Acetobacteraceae bacterium]